jgi:hypothetical protein
MNMKTTRAWIEIVILVTVIACGLALLFATLGAAASAAISAAESGPRGDQSTEQTYQGMVTCSRCGAKHSAALAQTATTCTRVCVHGGASFALVDAEVTYLLDGDLNVLKRLAGQRARIVGTRNGKTIRVSSVAAES